MAKCWSVFLGRYQGADVCGTVVKHHARTSFAVAQEAHRFTIRQNQVGQVESYDGTARLCINQLTEFADVLSIEVTADRKDYRPTHCAVNPQQRHTAWGSATAGPPTSGALRPHAEASLVDLQRFDFRFEGGTRNPQSPSGS